MTSRDAYACRTFNPPPPTSKRNFLLLLSARSFVVYKNETHERTGKSGVRYYYPIASTVWFWEIRQCGPPSDDIIAHAGDIYLDISTVPVGVYQNTSAGWTSCWSEPPINPLLKNKFLKLPHPNFKDRFLWTTKPNLNSSTSKGGILLSYISPEELNSRGGTEEDKQLYLLLDLRTFNPSITTAETLVARREAALQAGKGSWLDILDSTSSSLTRDTGNDSDSDMYVEKKDLIDDEEDDEDDEDDEEDEEDDYTDKTILSASTNHSVDKLEAIENTSCGGIADIAEVAQSILKEVKKISSATLPVVKYPASGNVYSGDSSTSPSSSNPPPKLESDSIQLLLSRLTAAIERERKEHLTEIDNCDSFCE